jgi:hypothetical protein
MGATRIVEQTMPVPSHNSQTQLPRAVIRRSERITKMIEDRRAAANPPEDAANTVAAPPAAPIAPPANVTTPEPSAPTNAANDLPPGDPRHNDVGYWKQRAKAVFGMFERVRGELQELKEKNRELRQQLATHQAAPAQEPRIDLESMFSPQEREQYGDDQLTLMARTAAKLSAKQVEAATKPLHDTIQDSRQSAEEQKWHAFSAELIKHCPDAFEIDKQPEWINWLRTVDEMSGDTYYDQLKRHEGRYNAAGVARLFNRYKAESGLGIAAPPAPGPMATPAAPAAPTPPISPRAGGGNAGGDPPPQTEPTHYTPAQVRDYFKRASLGKVKDAERTKFEAWWARQRQSAAA